MSSHSQQPSSTPDSTSHRQRTARSSRLRLALVGGAALAFLSSGAAFAGEASASPEEGATGTLAVQAASSEGWATGTLGQAAQDDPNDGTPDGAWGPQNVWWPEAQG